MKGHGLDTRAWELIEAVFARHPEIEKVRLFGSRANGKFGAHSDIDLALWGEIDERGAQRVAEELDELPLPHLFDVQVFDAIKLPALREHIERVGVVIYSARARAD